MIDGGNYVGFYAVHRATEIAIDKARASRFALVGVHNSWSSGRNAHYLEMIARAGFAGMHFACSEPVVAPPGGRAPAFGTNPIAFAMREPHPLIFDMRTGGVESRRSDTRVAAGPVAARRRCGRCGRAPTRDPDAARAGGILSFGGHKGFGLALTIQALGLLAGAALPRGQVRDFAFLFIVFDPALLVPPAQFKRQLAELIAQVKATPRQSDGGDTHSVGARIHGTRAQTDRRHRARAARV